MKMEQKECSETLAIKLHMPENNPKENTRYSKHDESLKSRIGDCCLDCTYVVQYRFVRQAVVKYNNKN
jgi:hypothetical protein